MLLVISLFMPDISLEMEGVLSMMVAIEVVGGAGNMDGRGGTAGRTVTDAVHLSAPRTQQDLLHFYSKE